MRSIFSLAVLASPTVAALARADDKQEAEAILAKGIQSLGGEAKLSKYQAATWRVTQKVSAPDMVLEPASENALQWPGKLRLKMQGANFTSLQILSGDQGWQQTDQGTHGLEERLLTAMQRAIYFQWIPVTLLPLKEKDFKLAVGDGGKVGGRPAGSIKVTPPRGPAFELFFDKESQLPVKMAMEVKVRDDGTEYGFAWLFSDYQEVQGIRKAMKVVIKYDYGEGRTLSEMQITAFKFYDRLHDDVFAKP